MGTYLWPNEDGWPYPDDVDVAGSDELDLDTLSLRLTEHQLLERLEPLEHAVVAARFGLDGAPERTMKQLHTDLGVPREELRQALGSGLRKLRAELID